MTVTVRTLIPGTDIPTTTGNLYTYAEGKTVIDQMTVTNVGTGDKSFSIYLVEDGGAPGTANQIIVNRMLTEDEPYVCIEVIGSCLEANAAIYAVASASGLTIRASGRRIV